MRAVIRNWIFTGGAVLLLAGCGGGDAFTSGEGSVDPTDPNPVTASSVSLGTTQTTVRSDNSDSATITATVLDANRAVVSDISVLFSTSAGQLTVASGVTDSNGSVSTIFSSGTADPTNTTATVTASVSGISDDSMQIQISGSGVDVVTPTSTSPLIGTTINLTIKAYNAATQPVAGAAISLAMAGTGIGTLGASQGETNSSGEFVTSFTGTAAGEVTITATGLGDTDSVTLNVQGSTESIQITAPAADQSVLGIGNDLTVTAATPSGTANVTFVTSLGTWAECADRFCTVAAGGSASATLNSPTPGTATVQVIDAVDPSLSDTTTVKVVVTDVDANSVVDLQGDTTTVAVSTASQANSTTLRAYVKDKTNSSPIANAPVVFSIEQTTGGGEYLSPTLAFTDADGYATTTFTSGTNTTGANGVMVVATIYDAGGTAVNSDSLEMVINQKAGSVKISPGTKILSTDDNTAYIQPMTVQVTDGAGNAVPGQTVTLRVWPKLFSTGYWTAEPCEPITTGTFRNEDLDRDLNRDPGEDLPIYELGAPVDVTGDGIVDTMAVADLTGPLGVPDGIYDSIDVNSDGVNHIVGTVESGWIYYFDGDLDGVTDAIVSAKNLGLNGVMSDSYDDGMLTPAGADAGSVPPVVTTDSRGLASFELTYAKNSAIWITDEITATTQVSGSETKGSLTMRLYYQLGEECSQSHSPFNPTTVVQ